MPAARLLARQGHYLEVEGDANDFVGKGMSGGRVVVYPPRTVPLHRKTTLLWVTWRCMALPLAKPTSVESLPNASVQQWRQRRAEAWVITVEYDRRPRCGTG